MRNIWRNYMDFQYDQASVIAIFLFVVSIAILYFVRKKYHIPLKKRDILILLFFSIYMTILLELTLFNRSRGVSYRIELRPLWSYVETIFNRNRPLGLQIFHNILAFIPFGIFLGWLNKQAMSLRNVLIIGAVLSCGIELCQLIFRCGLCELDDVLDNTIGTAIGYGTWCGAVRLSVKVRR